MSVALIASNTGSDSTPAFASYRGAVGAVTVIVTVHIASVVISPTCSSKIDLAACAISCDPGPDFAVSKCTAKTGSFVGT